MWRQSGCSVLSVNLHGATFLAQAVAAGMVAAGIKGSILNLSSSAAQGALPQHTAYCISKAPPIPLPLPCSIRNGALSRQAWMP